MALQSVHKSLTPNFNITINSKSEVKSQQTQFSDQTEQYEYIVDSMPDPSFAQADTNDAQLENFFSRPLKTRTYTWAPGINVFETFNPWTDYFENPRIVNRISNFNLLRAKLHVKIMLNGNGFYYGRAIASYTPLHTEDEFTQDRAYFIQDVVAASQRPHIYLDPTESQGGTLVLPFVWPKNSLSIPNADWRDMGDMHIHEMQQLKHANGAVDPITISVFVWAEDVHMSIPTQRNTIALTPQGGGDEYGDGLISRPAAVLAKAAGQLSNIPIIGPYAMATKLAASAVSGIAKIFGFSRPILLDGLSPYIPNMVGNLANASGNDTCTKLTLDPKQELTVDPRTMGLGEADEMTVKSIACRESFLTDFDWAITATSGDLLWNSEVGPVNWIELGREIHLPACAFAALPFKYWRGSMKFRFQVVASAYHKGRLQISYDPQIAGTGEFLTQYNYVIDIAKERDFTVEIGWGNEQGSLRHLLPGVASVPHGTGAIGPPLLPDGNNGVVSVRVLTDLTSPNSVVDNDVAVNVFISMGDDFEVFVPEPYTLSKFVYTDPGAPAAAAAPDVTERPPTPIQTLEPQSGEVMGNVPDGDDTKEESEPMKLQPSDLMAPKPAHTDCFDSVYFGDPIVSMRSCLKRYQLHSFNAKTLGSTAFTKIIFPNFPPYRGYDPNGMYATQAVGDDPYNYCYMTLLNYLTPAYTCRRGNIRWKYQRFGGTDNSFTSPIYLSYEPTSDSGYSYTENTATAINASFGGGRVSEFMSKFDGFWGGLVMNLSTQNPSVEAEMPFYLPRRFAPAKLKSVLTNNTVYNTFHRLSMIWTSGAAQSPYVTRFVSVGEDFTLNFFTGAPVIYYLPVGSDPPGLAT